jgi:hypothetical protein
MYLLQNVGEGITDVADVDDEGTFSRILEKVSLMLKSPRSMTKVPSPECWEKVC